MSILAELLTDDDVRVGVEVASRAGLFEHAGALFERSHAIGRAAVVDNLLARERLGSTGLGHGVAIPHGRIKGLKAPLAAVLRLAAPLAFDAPDGEAVSMFFLLLVPEAATQRHLEILGEMAGMLGDRALRERMLAAADAVELRLEIARWRPPVRP